MKALSRFDSEAKHARSVVVDDPQPATIVPILKENTAKDARVMRGDTGHYHHLRQSFAEHSVVHHGQE